METQFEHQDEEREKEDKQAPGKSRACLHPRWHRPYASMNWIRFNGSLRILAVSQPLAGTPLVNGPLKDKAGAFVKLLANARCTTIGDHVKLTAPFMEILFFRA